MTFNVPYSKINESIETDTLINKKYKNKNKHHKLIIVLFCQMITALWKRVQLEYAMSATMNTGKDGTC